MSSALCHDLGKPAVTEFKEGRIRSHGHESDGEEPTKKFLATLGAPGAVRERVSKLVINHLAPSLFYIDEAVRGKEVKAGAIRRLAERISPATIQELALVAESDHLGRGPFIDPEVPDQLLLDFKEYLAGEWILKRARALAIEKSKPADLFQGRDLMNLGFKQGKHMGEIIRLGNRLRDEKEFTREMVLEKIFEGSANPQKVIEKLTALLE